MGTLGNIENKYFRFFATLFMILIGSALAVFSCYCLGLFLIEVKINVGRLFEYSSHNFFVTLLEGLFPCLVVFWFIYIFQIIRQKGNKWFGSAAK